MDRVSVIVAVATVVVVLVLAGLAVVLRLLGMQGHEIASVLRAIRGGKGK